MTALTLDHDWPALTRRERVILANLNEDAILETIARRLYVSRNTVKTQVRSIYRKLGVSSRAEAIAKANELEVVT